MSSDRQLTKEEYEDIKKKMEHKAFIAPGEIKYKKKLRKYASYQNHLNRKGK